MKPEWYQDRYPAQRTLFSSATIPARISIGTCDDWSYHRRL